MYFTRDESREKKEMKSNCISRDCSSRMDQGYDQRQKFAADRIRHGSPDTYPCRKMTLDLLSTVDFHIRETEGAKSTKRPDGLQNRKSTTELVQLL